MEMYQVYKQKHPQTVVATNAEIMLTFPGLVLGLNSAGHSHHGMESNLVRMKTSGLGSSAPNLSASLVSSTPTSTTLVSTTLVSSAP